MLLHSHNASQSSNENVCCQILFSMNIETAKKLLKPTKTANTAEMKRTKCATVHNRDRNTL